MQEQDTSIGSPSSSVSFCPSFNSYSSAKLVDIATKVSHEEQKDDEDFEFVSIARDDPDALQLFFDGQIRQVYPVFNRDLLLNNDHEDSNDRQNQTLGSLFVEQGPSSSSSSEADELEGVPEETYCVWTPNKSDPIESFPSPNRCQKSNSTGSSSSSISRSSSKGWFKFRDLLKRSNSDGKDSFVFLHKTKLNSSSDSKPKHGTNEVKASGKAKVLSAHEAFYVKNRTLKQGDKKKSYLPYRQDLLGFFAGNVGVGRNFPPL